MTQVIEANQGTGDSTTRRRRLHAYREARRKGISWLLGKLNEDGTLGHPPVAIEFTARAPWTFAAVGETEAAAIVCAHYRRAALRQDNWMIGFDTYYAYRRSQLIIGAQLAGQYDVVRLLMRDIRAWRDPLSGAFPNDRLGDGSSSENMDIPFNCGVGFACLAVGDIATARQLASYLSQMYAVQRELPDRFFYALSRRTQRPIYEYPEEARRWYVVESQEDRFQRWTVGGMSAAFLCRLYLADPQPAYLDLARRYQAFSMGATEAQFKYAAVCKSSWGSSLLYQLTGEDQYLEWTYRMGDWYVESQHAEGHWTFDRTEQGEVIELVLEFVMHLDTLIGALASRP